MYIAFDKNNQLIAKAYKRGCVRCKKAVSCHYSFGASPSGKAAVFGTAIRGFESSRPSQYYSLVHLTCFS
jgi:hypothetical protein